jgi:serine/threonine protein kinase
MSQVYLATDTRLHHRKVAVKIMAGYLAAHPGYRKRFLREIQLMASLEHPNIMYVITAAGEHDQLLYLVMPRARGDLLARLEDGPLDLASTVDVITQVARALDHAHSHGISHRDVKPANILFGREGHVYLSDFGVARDRLGEDLTSAAETIGTRRYTAPEVHAPGAPGEPPPAQEADAAATPVHASAYERAGDVYSLGAVLYHCLTGRRPFDDLDISAAQQQGEVPMVSEARPDLPRALDDVVATAMCLDPGARYQSCGELAAAMNREIGLNGEVAALPILRDIVSRMPSLRDDRDRTASMPTGTLADKPRRPLIGTLTTFMALLILGGVLVYIALDVDRDSDDGTSPDRTGLDDSATVEDLPEFHSIDPTVEPVTGDGRVKRYPVPGECIDDDPKDYYVVSCESDAAADLIYEIVYNPADPNPAQANHRDAAWLVCGPEGGQDFKFYSRDSTSRSDMEWNPETDRIYWIMCYREL